MKRIFVISVVALLATISCSHKTNEQLLDEYNQASGELMEIYEDSVVAIEADSTLTDLEKREAYEKAEEDIISKMTDLCLGTMKKYPKDSVALTALGDIYYLADPDKLEDAISHLSKELKESELVQKVSSALQAKKTTKVGSMFTDFEIVQDESDPENSTVRFSDFIGQGKYMLVDFWASWCGPCKAEIPNIRSVWEKYHGEKFDVLSVAVWDKVEDTKAGAIENGIVWQQIINGQQIPTDIYGIEGIPQIMLFGPDGTILYRDLRGAAIEAAVADCLAE